MPATSPSDTGKWVANPASVGLYTVGTLLTGLVALTAPFLRRYGGAPYVASAPAARVAIRAALESKQGSKRAISPLRFTDLGSGSGELVLEAAKVGFQARGLELNRWLILRSQLNARSLPAQIRCRIEFQRRDLWTTDLEREDVVAIFGVPDIMEGVGEMVEERCKDDCLICCNTFPIPGWTVSKKNGGVYFYSVGEQRRRNTRKSSS